MKKIAIAVLATLAVTTAFADDDEVVLDSKMQADEYKASITCPAGYKSIAECVVKKATLETGWKLVKIGDQCYRDETRLDEMRKFQTGDQSIDIPQVSSHRVAVKCPA
jgi:hypothetical protein